jgi:hypothetical protein
MTTRAGFTGLLTGLAVTLILVYPLAIAHPIGYTPLFWFATAAAVTIGGGALAGRWSGSTHPIRCAALGGVAGGLAGTLVFCWLGAAAAGLTGAISLFAHSTDETVIQNARIEAIAAIVRQTEMTFLASFLGGIGLGLLGGWLACPRQSSVDIFNKSAPQMALNAAITALPASVVGAALATAVFSLLEDSVAKGAGEATLARSILELPLTVSLLLVLVSHFALTLVVPHEAQQAEHLCSMDEVKMAAYVGIGASPVLALLLFLVRMELFSNPLVVTALLAGAVMSLKSLQILIGVILPRRATFPIPQDDRQRTEAKLFGTISASNGPRLVVLCIGCGLMMILPLHVTIFSVLVNLYNLLIDPAFAQSAPMEVARKLFLTQVLVSTGLMAASAAILTSIYLFYLNLGRWFSRRGSRHTN